MARLVVSKTIVLVDSITEAKDTLDNGTVSAINAAAQSLGIDVGIRAR